MAYHDRFQPPEVYYSKINRLIDVYRANGYTSMVHDWERRLSKVADYPDLRTLSKRADFLYENLEHRT